MGELFAQWDLFAPMLLPKMVLIAAFAVTATVLAERAGPAVAGLIATLPVVTGPIYLLLALDHDARFIAAAAGVSVLALAPAVVMIVVYVFLAQRLNIPGAVGLALVAWLCATMAVPLLEHDRVAGASLAAAVFSAGIILVHPYRDAVLSAMPTSWSDLLIKGTAIAAMVGLVEIASAIAGPQMTGIFAAAPIVFVAMMVLIQSRHGGQAAAAVMAHALPGLAGLAVAFLCLSMTAVPLGVAKALPLALMISLGWNAALFAIHTLATRARELAPDAPSN